jgi:hypothetical protein
MTGTTDARALARGVGVAVAGLVLAAGAAVLVWSAIATASYQHAQAVRLEQALRLDASESALDAAVRHAQDDVALAEDALAAAPVGYVSADAAAALEAARAGLSAAIDAATGSALALPAAPVAFLDPTALTSAAGQLLDQAADADDAAVSQVLAIHELHAAEGTNADAGAALLESAKTLATTILPAHPSVANQPHVTFLKLQESLAAIDTLDSESVALLAEYVAAADTVSASHAAEEAEKSGPLYGLRAEVEAYARSISGGVLLDFNWQPIVIGHSMAGTATIESSPPYYYSTITLTNSIADNWGETVPVSLVTHEVGHAITSKCMDAFNSAFGGDYEQWATAWAMSWGYPAGPSGGDQYGVPTPEQVAVAGTCR